MPNKLKASHFSLRISYDEFFRVYTGTAKYVVTRSYDGRRIQFPANILRQFLTHDGIYGEFMITYDENNKFKAIKRL